MNIKKTTQNFIILFLLATSSLVAAQTGKVYTVKANELKAEIQPTMYGVFLKILIWVLMEAFTRS